jgi:ubiquinone biosynthesis protein COQ4
MNAATPTPSSLPIAQPPRPRRPSWRRALRALRALLDDPDDTQKAYEVFAEIDGNRQERDFQRLLRRPEGRRLAAERPSLARALADRAALAALPEGSFGRAALAHFERNGLEPLKLIELKDDLQARYRAAGEKVPELDATRRWYQERMILTHDLSHVLTDYRADPAGETVLLAFSLGQRFGRAQALLTFGAGLRATREGGARVGLEMLRAWRRGRRAGDLVQLPFESLLSRSLEEVRWIAGIEPVERVHPRGIPSGSFEALAQAA